MNMNKNGLAKTVTGLIILLIGASVLFLFISYIFPVLMGSTSDTICQQSIEARASAGSFGAQSTVPIKCQTKKICFVTDKSEECSEFKELDYGKIVIKKNYGENLIKEITIMQYDAWKLLGEGKWDYAPSEFWTIKTDKSYCAPYARIAMSNELRKEFDKTTIFSYEFINYQQRNSPQHSKTSYFRHLYGRDSLNELNSQISTQGVDINSLKFEVNKQYYIMSMVTKQTWLKTIIGGIVGGAGTAILASSGFGIVVLGGSAIAGGTGGATIGYFISSGESVFMPPSLIEYDAEAINSLECDDFDFSP
ncbi:hypothetical protein COV15_02625 [Candidatus Woesearchaeota archaeon CG10_big_fil_rev_8_21_14_0_10_34_12]|nr:MAG: hypothetical protein COV15_02625 [Candidatus Woesearchaeota archaeon CG10_big_fil_rev_8_21_14_0_10_34_12]